MRLRISDFGFVNSDLGTLERLDLTAKGTKLSQRAERGEN